MNHQTRLANEEMMPEDAICRLCKYPLHSLSENACPECGTEFVPNDKKTFTVSSELSRRKRPHLPSRWSLWLLGIVLLLWLNEISMPMQGGLLFWGVGLLMLLIILMNYVSRGFTELVDWRDGKRLNTKQHTWRWLALPCFILFMMLSSLSDWPLKLRFYLSKTAFDNAAKKFVSGNGGALFLGEAGSKTARGESSQCASCAGDTGLKFRPQGTSVEVREITA